MSWLLEHLESERGALVRRRDLAINRKRGFEGKLATLRAELRRAEHSLRSAKRAVLVGGPARLKPVEEEALVKRLVEGPVQEAALTDVLGVEDGKIAEIDAEIHAKEIGIINVRQDEVEVDLLRSRLGDLQLVTSREIVRDKIRGFLEHWEAGERGRKALGDTNGRPHPADAPDHYSRDAQGHERTRDETSTALTTRINELEARLTPTRR